MAGEESVTARGQVIVALASPKLAPPGLFRNDAISLADEIAVLKPCDFGTQSSPACANLNTITYRVAIGRVFGTGVLTPRGDESPLQQ